MVCRLAALGLGVDASSYAILTEAFKKRHAQPSFKDAVRAQLADADWCDLIGRAKAQAGSSEMTSSALEQLVGVQWEDTERYR